MQHLTRPKQVWRRFPALLIGAALLTSACASDESESTPTSASGAVTTAAPADSTVSTGGTDTTLVDSTEGSDTAATPDTTATTGSTADGSSPLGAENAATEDTLTLGYVYDGVSASVDRSQELETAEAAVGYVNEHLGGIAGRPIKLDVCETGSTPAGASDCVTQMVTDGVPIVINALTSVPATLYAPLAEAGIAVFTGGALDKASLSTPGIYHMGNSLLSVLAGPAQVAANIGATQAAIAVVDNPAASGALEESAPLFYGNVGVEVDIVAIPIDTPDVSPQILAELTKDPGLFQIVGDAPFCGKVMRALESAGYEGAIIVIPHCLEGASSSDLPNLEGVIVLSTNSTDSSAPEVQLYNAVLDAYAKNDDLDRFSGALAGYQAVVGLTRALAALQGDVTAETIKAALDSMPATPYPLADGLTFQCNKKQVSIAPNICTNSSLQTTLDGSGNGTTYEVLDGSKVLTLG